MQTILFMLFIMLFPLRVWSADLELVNINFLGVVIDDGYFFEGEQKVNVKKGDRFEVREFNVHSGRAPRLLELMITVVNHSAKPVTELEIRAAVSFKVGNMVLYSGVHDFPDHAATEKSAEWLVPVLLFRHSLERIEAKSSARVVLGPIKLNEYLSAYDGRTLWPVMMRAEASVEPLAPEDSLSNNTLRKEMRIRMLE